MKRILIVNVVLVGEESGTGNTLKNIYCNYTNTHIMQLSLQIKPLNFTTTIENTIFLTKACIPIDNAFRSVFFMRNLKKKTNSLSNVSAATIPQKNIKGAVHDFIRGLLDMSAVRLDNEILYKIDLFNPEIIYTCGCTIRIHKVANFLSKRYRIPIVLHLMDDWPETLYTSSFLSLFARKKINRELAITHSLSITNFAISEALCEKYENKFGKKYIPLMNPSKYITTNLFVKDKGIIEFIYAGSLSLNRWKSLLQVAEVLHNINIMKKCANMKLYIPSAWNTVEIKNLFEKYEVEINNYVANDKVYEVYERADVLIHVESFDENYRLFTRYSLSTKIPEYMGAGKPILAYLPKDLHGGEYITKNNAGLVAHNINDLKACIFKLVEDSSSRCELAIGGLACAKEKHSIDSVHTKLFEVVKNI